MLIKNRKEESMITITATQAKAIRRKQADNMLTNQEVAKQIGINPITYRKVIQGGEVKNSIYQKVMEWLAEDY
jgi:repressor-related protein